MMCPKFWVGTCLGLVVVLAVEKTGWYFSPGLLENHCPGLADGQGQPGVNLFTAAILGGCEAELCLLDLNELFYVSGVFSSPP